MPVRKLTRVLVKEERWNRSGRSCCNSRRRGHGRRRTAWASLPTHRAGAIRVPPARRSGRKLEKDFAAVRAGQDAIADRHPGRRGPERRLGRRCCSTTGPRRCGSSTTDTRSRSTARPAATGLGRRARALRAGRIPLPQAERGKDQRGPRHGAPARHRGKNGKLAVVAVLLDEGKESALIKTLWATCRRPRTRRASSTRREDQRLLRALFLATKAITRSRAR